MPQSKRHPARRPDRRPTKSGHRNPAAAAKPAPPQSSGWRRSLEKASVGPLFLLNSMPRLVVPLLLGILLVIGLAVHSPWAGLVLVVPALFLLWLLVLSWPVISPAGRAVRLIAVLAVGVAAVLRLAGVF